MLQKVSTGGHGGENPQPAKGPQAHFRGAFLSRKGFEGGSERALKRNFTGLTTFPPWPAQGEYAWKLFFPFSLSGGRCSIKQDVWNNIFKFLSHVWFCACIPCGALTSDNILGEDGSKTKQNMHCPHVLQKSAIGCPRTKRPGQPYFLLTCVSQWQRPGSQFPLCSFPVYSQGSPAWHTQSPEEDRGGCQGLGGVCHVRCLSGEAFQSCWPRFCPRAL